MKSPSGLQVVGLGESLFDVFEDQTILGGAPLNVALCANQCLASSSGCGVVASRVGRDPLGRRLIRELTERGHETSYVQIDDDRPTGKVLVEIRDGQPNYDILKPAAWDALQFDRRYDALATACDAVCFGTLAQRSAVSREAIDRFLTSAQDALKLFDVNLRQDYYSRSMIENSLNRATALKLNSEELEILTRLLDLDSPDPRIICPQLLQTHGLRFVALTQGAEGMQLYLPSGFHASEPACYPSAPGADAVGAGDAASAGLILGFLRHWDPEQTLYAASHLGAYVASVPGATPPLPDSILELFS